MGLAGLGLGLLRPMHSSLQQVVKLDYQFVELGGVFFFDDAIAEGSDFVLFLGRHSD